MPGHGTTYDIASPQIAEYVQTLWHGALAPPVDTRDQDGRRLTLTDDHLSGHSVILIFLNDCRPESAVPVLAAWTAATTDRAHHHADIIAISSSSDAEHNRALKNAAGFRWPIAGDSTGALFAAYGLHKHHGTALRTVLVTPLRQLRAWFDAPAAVDDGGNAATNTANTIETIMDIIDDSARADASTWAPPHAPVLLVPQVLTPEECAHLVASFENGGPFMVRPPRAGEVSGNYKIPVYEHDRQDRVDQIIRNPDTLAVLDERLWGRIAPMIRKAFAFEATRREDMHIARYVGARGGHRMGHRDNTGPTTSYRRFALSMSLNDDYEGGEIVFREFSTRGYRPDPGTALIFSSSLLHEVQETTRGVRYNLISHLYNEESVARR